MPFSAATSLPADVTTAQGTGHLAHHSGLRAALDELRNAGLALGSDLTGLARRVLTQKAITASYTVIAADLADTVLHVTAGSAITITLPSGLATETALAWRQFGAGQITFAAGSGMTLVARGGASKSTAQYSGGIVTCVNSTTWLLEGDITT